MKTHKTPRIASVWQPLYKPQETGCYVNDHSIIRAQDGSWHLFGISKMTPNIDPENERYFTHGRSDRLISGDGFKEVGIVCSNGVRAWAPSVVSDGKRYFMHYGPSPMRLATSLDLKHWMEHSTTINGAPLDSCHRDSMVIKRDEGGWLMYITGITDEMYGVISVLESDDLVNWRFLRYALETKGNAPFNPAWGATESPFVVKIEDLYYLFITYTKCNPENYHNTLVFCSEDPTNFGNYSGDNEDEVVIAKLHAHAPEVIQDDDGQWYITSCGWRDFGTVIEGGVAIAKLDWT